MSRVNINPFFQFVNSVITGLEMHLQTGKAMFFVRPDKRFTPRCHQCGQPIFAVHSYHSRFVRDLNFAGVPTYLKCQFRKLRCEQCGIKTEILEYVDAYQRVTRRMAQYIVSLCCLMTVQEVAEHLGLDWKTVKEIDKAYLKEAFSKTDYENLRIIALDEIAIRKGHSYLTVVIDWETGRIVWMGEGRSKATIDRFFQQMPENVRCAISAAAMDMWQPYIKAVSQWCPQADIVFDGFHVIASFNRVIDQVRNEEYRQAEGEDKGILKGLKYLLTMNKDRMSFRGKLKLFAALELNRNLSAVYMLKEYLKLIWKIKDPDNANFFLDYWCQLAYQTHLQPVMKFADMLLNHRQGIINHCQHPINTGKLEGMNNALKVLKRKHYGFHDIEYFILKAKSRFDGCN